MNGKKPMILAVDDSPDILTSLEVALQNDYDVFKLPKPTELKRVLMRITLNPDLFLLDYQMPELSGFELIPIIRSFEVHKKKPIILLTSSGTMAHISMAVALGAVDFIVKPFDPDTLREKIAKHLVKN